MSISNSKCSNVRFIHRHRSLQLLQAMTPISPATQDPSLRGQNEHQSLFQKQRYTLMVLATATMCLSFTIFFAYNSSIQHPLSTTLILAQPERSISVLNILSQITIFLFGWLTSTAMENVRWAYACSRTGTSTYTFLVLSGATNIVGVLRLLVSKDTRPDFRRDGHRLWGSQRYFSSPLR